MPVIEAVLKEFDALVKSEERRVVFYIPFLHSTKFSFMIINDRILIKKLKIQKRDGM